MPLLGKTGKKFDRTPSTPTYSDRSSPYSSPLSSPKTQRTYPPRERSNLSKVSGTGSIASDLNTRDLPSDIMDIITNIDESTEASRRMWDERLETLRSSSTKAAEAVENVLYDQLNGIDRAMQTWAHQVAAAQEFIDAVEGPGQSRR